MTATASGSLIAISDITHLCERRKYLLPYRRL
jgi:hypothetical protein